jgi:hypothetical protein
MKKHLMSVAFVYVAQILFAACSAGRAPYSGEDSDVADEDPEGDTASDTSTCGQDTGQGAVDIFAGVPFNQDGLPVELPEDFFISLERTACNGTCPEYVVSADRFGNVTWEGSRYVFVEGPASYTVDVDSLRSLVSTFRLLSFHTFRDYYWDGKSCSFVFSDYPTYIFTIRLDGHEKEVRYYTGCFFCRDYILVSLGEEIDSRLGVDVLIP